MRPPSTIPGNSISRLIAGDKPVNNLEVIIQYLSSEEGAVILSDKQKELLNRLSMADDLMRKGQNTMEIANMLMQKFSYGIATARRDISDAQYVWGTQVTRSKNYLVTLHIDRIRDIMQKLIAKEAWGLLIKLMDVYTNALKLLPEDRQADTTPAAVILNFGLNVYPSITGKQPDVNKIIDIAHEILGEDAKEIKDLLDD